MTSTTRLNIQRIDGHTPVDFLETLAVEEPLEIRLESGPMTARLKKTISITMRTPGHDFALAVGFLYTEGIVRRREDVADVQFCGPSGNVVRVELKPEVAVDIKRLERHFYTSSSCGVCGKTSIEALRVQAAHPPSEIPFRIPASLVHTLPEKARAAQDVFERTGGLHASTLFDERGGRISLFEDVGRHNALDKAVGDALLKGLLPLERAVLLVSGRASFELVQKAAMAGLPVMVAVGAPSSLAVELARDVGMTVIGFVRDNRFNIYNGNERIICDG